MKPHLLFHERDAGLDVSYSGLNGFTVEAPPLPWGSDDLAQDLGLVPLLQAMAQGDVIIFEVAKQALFNPLLSADAITYRQEILADCIAHPGVFREIYEIGREAIRGEHEVWRPWGNHPNSLLDRSVTVLDIFLALLKQLRRVADENATKARSQGMTEFFAMLVRELDEPYFATVAGHLERLKFKAGSLMSARLGSASRGTDYVLRSPRNAKPSFRERVGLDPPNSASFQLAPRDEAGSRYLSELKDRGLNLVANALAQSTDHITSFFKLLVSEVGFYVGCLNLAAHLSHGNRPICRPYVKSGGSPALSFRGIYDVSLALRSEGTVVGNDASADLKTLVMITGANSGGKSTLLRSMGLAQVMMQAGMFVGAEAFSANLCHAVFSHFIREEDEMMTSGKLDEELARMSAIVERIGPGDLILFNESFAATNEREGSEIAYQVVTALLETGVKVMFVTHQFTLANRLYQQHGVPAMFLRAERGEAGIRTYKLVEAPPLSTSFGEDLFEQMGGWNTTASRLAVAPRVNATDSARSNGSAESP